MTIKEFKEKVAKIDKRLWVMILCIVLYVAGVVFFVGTTTGRTILSIIAYILYITGTFWGATFLYSYLKTYFGLNKKKEEKDEKEASTCEVSELVEENEITKAPNTEINYDLSEVDDGEYGAPYSGLEDNESK